MEALDYWGLLLLGLMFVVYGAIELQAAWFRRAMRYSPYWAFQVVVSIGSLVIGFRSLVVAFSQLVTWHGF